jgi:hypothetical protein
VQAQAEYNANEARYLALGEQLARAAAAKAAQEAVVKQAFWSRVNYWLSIALTIVGFRPTTALVRRFAGWIRLKMQAKIFERPTSETIAVFAGSINRQYRESKAEQKVIKQVIADIETRQGLASFDLANSLHPVTLSGVPEPLTTAVKKRFAIGLALASNLSSGYVFTGISSLFSDVAQGLAAASLSRAKLVQIIHVNEMDDLIAIKEAVDSATKKNDRHGNASAIVGIVLGAKVNAAVERKARVLVVGHTGFAPVVLAKEGQGKLVLKEGHLTYAQLFQEFSSGFKQAAQFEAQHLVAELAEDKTDDKRVVVIGSSKTPYTATERLISIMFSLLPIAGRYLMINIRAVLEAAKMA